MTMPYFDDQYHVDHNPRHAYWARVFRWAVTPTGRRSKYWVTAVAYGAGPSGLLDRAREHVDLPRLPSGYTWSAEEVHTGERSPGGVERLARAAAGRRLVLVGRP